jgi:hypothetical protein
VASGIAMMLPAKTSRMTVCSSLIRSKAVLWDGGEFTPDEEQKSGRPALGGQDDRGRSTLRDGLASLHANCGPGAGMALGVHRRSTNPCKRIGLLSRACVPCAP